VPVRLPTGRLPRDSGRGTPPTRRRRSGAPTSRRCPASRSTRSTGLTATCRTPSAGQVPLQPGPVGLRVPLDTVDRAQVHRIRNGRGRPTRSMGPGVEPARRRRLAEAMLAHSGTAVI